MPQPFVSTVTDPQVPKDSRYILLVEDNQDDIDLTLRALEKHDLADGVVVLKDGVEALDFLSITDPAGHDPPKALPRLILLDINLPRLNGLEVLKALREHASTKLVPVVMLTSSANDRDVLESYARGANSYIQKPVSFTQFTDTVKELTDYWLTLNQSAN